MGGKDSENFGRFCDIACRAYNLIRRNSSLFVNLFALMLSTGIPELQSIDDLEYLRDALAPTLTDQVCACGVACLLSLQRVS
jgi:hypothetical protein